MDQIERLLSHPILWGVLALVAISIALSGRLSVSAAGWVMWSAWALAVFGVFRVTRAFNLDFKLSLLVLGAIGCALAIAALLVNRWYGEKEYEPTFVANSRPTNDKPAVIPGEYPRQLVPPKPKDTKPATKRPKPDASSVTLRTYLQQSDDSYLEGTLLGGILWQKNFFDVRLDIGNGPIDIHNLDFLVGLDTSVAGVGQISQFPGITTFPERSPVPPAWLEGEDAEGKRIVIPIAQAPGMISIAPVWRVHCSDVFANTVLHLVIASIATNPPGADSSLPHELFAPRRPPRRIKVQGEYETTNGEKHPVQLSYQFKPQ